jgi:hypothetical protein
MTSGHSRQNFNILAPSRPSNTEGQHESPPCRRQQPLPQRDKGHAFAGLEVPTTVFGLQRLNTVAPPLPNLKTTRFHGPAAAAVRPDEMA